VIPTSVPLRLVSVWLAVVCTAAAVLLWLANPLPLQTLRHQGFDQYQRWQPRPYVPVPVRIVDIDEASLQRLGQWPWPRTRLAELVQRLRDAGAAAVVFDVLLAEPDRTSPQRVAQDWALTPALRQQLHALPDHDAVLAQTLADSPVVLGLALQRDRAPTADESPPRIPARFVWVGGEPVPEVLHGFRSAVPALPALQQAAAGLGVLTFVPDTDGVVRRIPLALRLGDQLLPTLLTEALRVGQGANNILLRRAEGEHPALQEVRIGDFTIPTTAQGEMWVHYSEAVPERYLPAWQVLSGAVDRTHLEGQVVLLGSSAQGLMDLRFNPLGRVMPGVEAHAQGLEQVLAGQFLSRPSWAPGAEVLVLLLGTLAVVLLATRGRALWAALATAGLIAALLWGGWWAFSRHGLLLDSFVPALTLLLAFVLASLVHHTWSEQQQRFIKQAFARYVSPNRVEYLVRHPDDLHLGGERRHCSFVFTDLAGFTSLMERSDPAEALGWLNRYLEGMVEIAFRHQGTLDRIVGDAVAIMFSAPVPQPDHARRALDCALQMQAFASRYAEDLQARGVAFGHTRIGVHSGEVIVGNFGGRAIFDYRALGDPVNTAARLESVNKQLGTRLCVSGTTLEAARESVDGAAVAKGLTARPVGSLVLKGKTQALPVFEPVGPHAPTGYAPMPAYLAAYRAMAENAPDAAAQWNELARRHPDDPLVRLHQTRLARGERGEQIVFDSK